MDNKNGKRTLYIYFWNFKRFSVFRYGYPYLTFTEIFHNYFVPDELTSLVQSNDRERENCSIKRGDVFLTRTSETDNELGMSCVALKDYPNATFNGFTKRLRPLTDDVIPEYAGFYFRSPIFRAAVTSMSSIITRASLNEKMLDKLPVCYPSKKAQQKIASILSAYDRLIQNYKKQIEALQTAASELYKEWFVRFRFPGWQNAKFENGIPEGWKIEKVKQIFEIYDTERIPLSSLDRGNMEKKYPYYGAAELMDYVDDYLFDGIYLLMGEDGSVITPDGKPVLQYVWGKFWVNNHTHVIQGKGVYSTEYLYLLFSQMDITGIVTGSAQPKISQGRLFSKKIVLPSEDIVRKFNSIIQPMYTKQRYLNSQIKNLTQQRDLLLPRLMSGKLEV